MLQRRTAIEQGGGAQAQETARASQWFVPRCLLRAAAAAEGHHVGEGQRLTRVRWKNSSLVC